MDLGNGTNIPDHTQHFIDLREGEGKIKGRQSYMSSHGSISPLGHFYEPGYLTRPQAPYRAVENLTVLTVGSRTEKDIY